MKLSSVFQTFGLGQLATKFQRSKRWVQLSFVVGALVFSVIPVVLIGWASYPQAQVRDVDLDLAMDRTEELATLFSQSQLTEKTFYRAQWLSESLKISAPMSLAEVSDSSRSAWLLAVLEFDQQLQIEMRSRLRWQRHMILLIALCVLLAGLFAILIPALVVTRFAKEAQGQKQRVDEEISKVLVKFYEATDRYGDEPFQRSGFWIRIAFLAVETIGKEVDHPASRFLVKLVPVVRREYDLFEQAKSAEDQAMDPSSNNQVS